VRGVSKASRNRENARQRIARERAEAARRRKQRIWAAIGGGVVVVAAAAVGITLAVTGGGSPATATTEPLSVLGTLKPALAAAGTAASGQTIDGISCAASEQTLFHIHAHLTIFVDGVAKQVPAGIGIPGPQSQNTPQGTFVGGGTCLYWLHTHAADGIVHIESPVKRAFTLGQFFDEWGQPLGPSTVGPANGTVVTIVDGKVYKGDPRNVDLTKHEQIQLEVGKPYVGPETIKFPSGL
jgi:hypothetical protein